MGISIKRLTYLLILFVQQYLSSLWAFKMIQGIMKQIGTPIQIA